MFWLTTCLLLPGLSGMADSYVTPKD
jgi:hypothetical protein